jgi:hypothetical protein
LLSFFFTFSPFTLTKSEISLAANQIHHEFTLFTMIFIFILAPRPLLLAMQEGNLQASWQAMLDVAASDGRSPAEALRVVRKRPGCLIAPAEEFKGQWHPMAEGFCLG